MARFYGFSNEEIEQMQYETFKEYHDAIEILRARDILDALIPVNFQQATNQYKTETHRKFHRVAYPDTWEEKKPVTLEQLSRMINGG